MGKEMEVRPKSWVSVLKQWCIYIMMTVMVLTITVCGLAFWSQTIESCEKEGSSFMFCVATMRYQAAKELVKP